MIISYKLGGRFGNNLFQYIATKIVQLKCLQENRIYNYIYDNYDKIKENCFIVDDNNFFDVIGDINSIPLNTNICLIGYFQFDKHIIENKPYLLKLLNENNYENINQTYTVSYLANRINEFKRRFDKDEVVIHLRLDDFIGDKVCMHYINYFNIISNFSNNIKKVIIIVDKCRQKWELEYLNLIYYFCVNKNLEVKIESGCDMFDDFCKLYYSVNFLSSNSTFSYLAGLLGEHELNWCPVGNTVYSHQKIENFNDCTIQYKIIYLDINNDININNNVKFNKHILEKIKIVVINLEKHNDRKKHMENVLNKINSNNCFINSEFFKAIDGRSEIKQLETSCKEIDMIIYNNKFFMSFYNERIDYNFRGKLSLGQIGADLSHLFVCEQLLFDDKHDFYLVLEDDCDLLVDNKILQEYLENLPESFDFIHLDMSDAYEFEKTIKENNYFYNVKKQFFNRASSYIISKIGASKYVSYVKHNICRPPDDSFSNLFLFKHFKVLIPNQWLFTLSEHSKISTIGY
jgi:hypothetical protein